MYYLTTGGMMTCSKADDGAIVWQHEFEDMVFHASPVRAGDAIYATSTDGVTVIVRAGAGFEQINQASLGERVESSAAFCRGRVYVRTEGHMYCIAAAGDQP